MSDYPEAWVTAAAEALAEKTGARSHVRDQARAVLDAVAPTIRAEAWSDAIGVVERQTNLTELVHFDRPSDFRKGVLTCIAALQAEALNREDAQE